MANSMELIHTLPSPLPLTRKEILDLLLKEEYGYLPPAPLAVTVTEAEVDERFAGGKAPLRTLRMEITTPDGAFAFPLYYVCPAKANGPLPCIIHINFRPDVPDRYMPSEELADHGYAVLSFGYEDVTLDNDDFTSGLAGLIYKQGRKSGECGKIGLWAWTCLRVFEYALTLPEIDHEKISLAGHSRLGKTALLAGALEERVHAVFANASGTSGAALFRENQRERLEILSRVRPYWFCGNYKKYADQEDQLPFDQHFLLAANASHKVFLTSAMEDEWSDYESEYLSACAADPYFKAQGKTGFVHPDRLPAVGDFFGEGDIGYQVRPGYHFLSRTDWLGFLRFLR